MDSLADRWLRDFETRNPHITVAHRQPTRDIPRAESQSFTGRQTPEPTTRWPISNSSRSIDTHPSQGIQTLLQSAIRLRRSRGETQASFAYRLGINVRTWQEWEQGRRRPSGPARTLLERGLKELGSDH